MINESTKFDANRNIWIYKISSNGVSFFGYGETEYEARMNMEKEYLDLRNIR